MRGECEVPQGLARLSRGCGGAPQPSAALTLAPCQLGFCMPTIEVRRANNARHMPQVLDQFICVHSRTA